MQAQVLAVRSHWRPGCEVKESLQVGERRGLLENLKRNLLTFPFCLKLILDTARSWKRTFHSGLLPAETFAASPAKLVGRQSCFLSSVGPEPCGEHEIQPHTEEQDASSHWEGSTLLSDALFLLLPVCRKQEGTKDLPQQGRWLRERCRTRSPDTALGADPGVRLIFLTGLCLAAIACTAAVWG